MSVGGREGREGVFVHTCMSVCVCVWGGGGGGVVLEGGGSEGEGRWCDGGCLPLLLGMGHVFFVHVFLLFSFQLTTACS